MKVSITRIGCVTARRRRTSRKEHHSYLPAVAANVASAPPLDLEQRAPKLLLLNPR
jgi:hypothetical protein